MDIVWAKGCHYKVSAKVAYQEVERICAKNGGIATPDAVVAAAKSVRNPLHEEFEWDNAVAAHEHRLNQARSMLRSIKVIREELPDRPHRVYEVVRGPSSDEGKPRKVYQSVEDIMADPDKRAELLSRALRELVAWQKRYRHLQELAIAFRATDELVTTLQV